MTDQEKDKLLNFKEKYKNNPVAFVEDFYPDIKLLPYQKLLLQMINTKEKTVSFFNARMNQKLWLSNMQLEYMKEMEIDFQVWGSKGIDVYEKGVLIKTIKNK